MSIHAKDMDNTHRSWFLEVVLWFGLRKASLVASTRRKLFSSVVASGRDMGGGAVDMDDIPSLQVSFTSLDWSSSGFTGSLDL